MANDTEALHRLSELLVEFFEKFSSWEHGVVRGEELTLPQMHTVEILGATGPMRMKELAGKMGVTTGTLTVLVDKLEDKGVVRRMPNKDDRRSILVGLTEEGQAHYRSHDKHHLSLTRELTAELESEDMENLLRLLDTMNSRF
ncbi:MAG: MarR family winged helix-turn-helix transcriptional regulator [Desulfovibrio sp.]|uniref:MarR family winged helix-turn-helix transcriptional regulator n=1 Tax=Desulfovibrio sp. 7SRBS1 TaxID=3378064 RepID=UPI003B3E104C